jgi:putative membrane protein insertion efficiency factor
MIKKFFLLLIDVYTVCISPLLPKSCRYYPTCSMYAKEAIVEHGVIRGLYLTIKRLLKCNPFFSGGYDPVRKKQHKK